MSSSREAGRFESYSRGVFESRQLLSKERKWGTRPSSRLVSLGLIVAIGGVIGGIKLWSDNRTVNGWGGSGDSILRPLSTSEAVVRAEASRGDDGQGAGAGEAEEGAKGVFREAGSQGEGSEGSGNARESGGGNSEESGRSGQEARAIREGSQEAEEEKQKEKEKQDEKERTYLYLSRRRSPLADFVEEIYQEEEDAGILNLSRLVVAIAGAEQNFGKVSNFHNLWGIKCGSTTYCRYLSLKEGIKAITSLLAGPIYGLGEEVTEEDIWRIAPTYAESSKWPSDVVYFWRKLEGR